MGHVITDRCVGCGVCLAMCPVGAVSGEKNGLHLVSRQLCIDCGTCGRVCTKGAVEDESGRVVERVKRSLWKKPVIDMVACYACENCVAACPVGALGMADEALDLTRNYAVLAEAKRCVSCRWCVTACQFDAISMEGAA